jgi:hypothetical protein
MPKAVVSFRAEQELIDRIVWLAIQDRRTASDWMRLALIFACNVAEIFACNVAERRVGRGKKVVKC